MRISEINRNTAETKISLKLNLDGTGKTNIDTGVGFLNHMLTLFAAHGKFDMTVVCSGDTDVDDHHSVEDIGICLGQAFQAALGDKRGITRYGSFLLPMDEALILSAVDISGRSCLCCDHHIVEGAFKSVGRALKAAVALDGSNEIPSTKGVL